MRYYLDRFGNDASEAEATDGRGVIRDGYSIRRGFMDSGYTRTSGRIVFHDSDQTFADSAAGRAALAREEYIAGLNGREPRTAAELYTDGQVADAYNATRASMVIGDAASARTAAMSARDQMIADLAADRK